MLIDRFRKRRRSQPPDHPAVDEIRRAWKAWQELEYPRDHPPGGPDGVIEGIDLALLDAAGDDVAWTFCEPDSRPPGEVQIARLYALRDLERVVPHPHLSDAGKAYFGALLELLRALDAVQLDTTGSSPTGSGGGSRST